MRRGGLATRASGQLGRVSFGRHHRRSSPIVVLVVYPPEARRAVGGRAAIRAILRNNADLTNLAHHNSGIGTRIRLVHTQEVELPDSVSSNGAHLEWLRTDPQVSALREAFGADLVGLLYERWTSVCGTAAMLFRPGTGSAEDAVFDVWRESGVSSLTFAHDSDISRAPTTTRKTPTASTPTIPSLTRSVTGTSASTGP